MSALRSALSVEHYRVEGLSVERQPFNLFISPFLSVRTGPPSDPNFIGWPALLVEAVTGRAAIIT